MSLSFSPTLEHLIRANATDAQLLAEGYTIFEVTAMRAKLHRAGIENDPSSGVAEAYKPRGRPRPSGTTAPT